MAPTILNPVPQQVTAGDSIAWRVTATLNQSGDDWALSTTLISQAGKILLPASVPDGNDHLIIAPSTTTIGWAPGEYRLHIAAVRGAERVTLITAQLRILPDPATAEPYDPRSHARKVLAAIEAYLENADYSASRTRIADRELQNIPIAELLQLRDRYRSEVRREDAIERTGRAINKIQVRL